jgi:nickel-type superoxide dismutase maturation protease
MLRLLKVTGNSLSPEYQEGDFVVATTVPFLFRSPRQGEVVILRHPAYGTLIKRLVRISADEFEVGSDQPGGVDSRSFGALPIRMLTGRVIAHIRGKR